MGDTGYLTNNQKGMTMLVLSRKLGESIQIGDDVFLYVSEIGSDFVKLAIKAPRDVAVDRSEIRAAKEREKANEKGD